MLPVSLLILSICIGTILLTIHSGDEIHQLVAFLSGSLAIVCAFILTPPIVKALLSLIFITIGYKMFPTYD